MLRPSPSADGLRAAFRCTVSRTQRKSDGTFTLDGVRYEIPSRFRTLRALTVRYARWDLSLVELYDPRTGLAQCRVFPIDKAANADGHRRRVERLSEMLRTPELLPLGTRIRARLRVEPRKPDELQQMLARRLEHCGNNALVDAVVVRMLAEHAAGNPRVLMTAANELLDAATAREQATLDEKLYLEVFGASVSRPPTGTATAAAKAARR